MNDLQNPQASRTAEFTKDHLGLGRTAGQRNAEIVAGIRAELDPTPLHHALCRYSGRLAAKMLNGFGGTKSYEVLSAIVLQTRAMVNLASHYLSSDALLLVNLAPGFGPHGYQLAKRFPQLQVLEIDLPDVVKEKERRLRKGLSGDLPANLSWKAADLGTEALDDVLEERKADMIFAPGLMSYFYPEEVKNLTSKIKNSLKPDGYFIGDVAWHPELSHFRSGASWFGRNSAHFLCMPKTVEEAKALLQGYNDVAFYYLAEMLTEEDKKKNFRNMTVMLAAQV